jgi:hypothetical protein
LFFGVRGLNSSSHSDSSQPYNGQVQVTNQFVPDDHTFAVTFPTLPPTAQASRLKLRPDDEGQSVVVNYLGQTITLTWVDGHAGDSRSIVNDPRCSGLFGAPAATRQNNVTIAAHNGVQCEWRTGNGAHEIGQFTVIEDRLYAFTALGPPGNPNAPLDPIAGTLELRS